MPAILHVDMDAFFAAVEQRDRPELRGRPVIVGARPGGRGVVSAASYEARPFGVHSAMPINTAHRLCPHAVFLPVRMSAYAAVAEQLRAIFHEFTALVEPLSVDEAFLDVRGTEAHFGGGPAAAVLLRRRIREETDLLASVGVAPNKFLAKLASELAKPDGLRVIEADAIRDTLAPLPVGRLWGVGGKMEKRLHALGLRTVGQIAALPRGTLAGQFGESGRHLEALSRGEDDRPVVPDGEAKSLGAETTFAQDIEDRESLRGWLLGLVDELASRLRRHALKVRTVSLKVRTADFETHGRAVTLPEATDGTARLWAEASRLFDERVPDAWLPVRLIGVSASNLVDAGAGEQGLLFEGAGGEKQRAIDRALDEVRRQFGQGAVVRAAANRRRKLP